MDSRNPSDGAISPGAILPKANGHRSSIATTAAPSWSGPAQSPGIGQNGDPFTSSNSNGKLRAGAASFAPAARDELHRRLRFLSLGATADADTPTIVTSNPAISKNTVQEPIGTKSSNSSPVHPKAWFSTDLDPNKPPMPGHFLLIIDLKDGQLKIGIIALIESTYSDDIRGKKIVKHAEHDDNVDCVLLIDDLRVAEKIYADLENEGSLEISYVSYDWYSGSGIQPGSHVPTSMYVAQVTVIAEFKGRTSDFDPSINVFDFVREFAEEHGVVLAFEQNKAAQYPLYQFRVEYFKISSAEKAMTVAGDGIKPEGVTGWVIFVKQYSPPSCDPVAAAAKKPFSYVTAVPSPAVFSPPAGAEIVMSPTGRTAWYTTPDGVSHPVPPPRSVANVDRVVLDNSMAVVPFKGKEVAYNNTSPQDRRFDGRNGVYNSYEALYGPFEPAPTPYRGTIGFGQQDYGDQPGSDIYIDRIYSGKDVRTTVMLRNVPTNWTWRDMKAHIDPAVECRYNFMYLRIDFNANKNVGYCFINFENATDIVDFVNAFVGKPWDPSPTAQRFDSGKHKVTQMSYATVQGLEALIEKFRNSSVMDENKDYTPHLFQTVSQKIKDEEANEFYATQGMPILPVCEIGEKKPFAPPNNRAKKERSTANAGQIGLFTPRNALVNRMASDRWFRSQFDRGTPAQLMEDRSFTGPPSAGYMSAPPSAGLVSGFPSAGLMSGPPSAGLVVPPHVANYSFGPLRHQAVYPPSMGVGFNNGSTPFNPYMPGPPFMYGGAPRPYMPDTPTRGIFPPSVQPTHAVPAWSLQQNHMKPSNHGVIDGQTNGNKDAGAITEVNGHKTNGNGA